MVDTGQWPNGGIGTSALNTQMSLTPECSECVSIQSEINSLVYERLVISERLVTSESGN